MADYELICVPPEEVTKILPLVEDHIKQGCKRGDDIPYKDLEASIVSGLSLVWLAAQDNDIAGVCVTQLLETENGKVCTLASLGGDRWSEWKHLLSGIEDYAAKEGCNAVRFYGRKGWLRAMPDYKFSRVVMEKKLHHVH